MGAFKAYDIRGIYNKDFDKETVYKVGYFLPTLLSTDHVVVGRDVRLTSPEIHEYLLKGITDSGADVWDLGLATTPMVYFSTVFLSADASVQITASHNPKEYNGLKISRKDAIPVGGDSGLKELEKLVREEKVSLSGKKGIVKDYSYVKDEYVKYLRNFRPQLEGLNISIDCSNGMANLIIKDVLENDSVHYIYDTFDGSFPNHEPNPLEEKNCSAIKAETLKNGSDVGIIYDGDADRVMFIDEKGRFIQPDYITAVLGYYYMKKGLKGDSLVDIRTSRSTTEYLESLGFPPTIWKVGHAFAKLKIREIDGIFGGELAGHYYFRKDFFNCDSGVLASLLVLSVVKSLKLRRGVARSVGDEKRADDEPFAAALARRHDEGVRRRVGARENEGQRLGFQPVPAHNFRHIGKPRRLVNDKEIAAEAQTRRARRDKCRKRVAALAFARRVAAHRAVVEIVIRGICDDFVESFPAQQPRGVGHIGAHRAHFVGQSVEGGVALGKSRRRFVLLHSNDLFHALFEQGEHAYHAAAAPQVEQSVSGPRPQKVGKQDAVLRETVAVADENTPAARAERDFLRLHARTTVILSFAEISG